MLIFCKLNLEEVQLQLRIPGTKVLMTGSKTVIFLFIRFSFILNFHEDIFFRVDVDPKIAKYFGGKRIFAMIVTRVVSAFWHVY